ncbi:MAG: ATP-binding protein [Desulfitobacterium hafniense]|nr:ATP-binding protein [Desulfitobacterium hafniense]
MDQKQIIQVILNLARNGLEAMEKGRTLTIRTSAHKANTVLEIRDEGPGIPPEILEKIGTPFLTTKETGTGLGLAVCYSILENHKAQMKIQSGVSGTTFIIYFNLGSH